MASKDWWRKGEEELPRFVLGTSPIIAAYCDESVSSHYFHHYQGICRACIPVAMDAVSRSTFERSFPEHAKPNDQERIQKEPKRSD